MGWLGVRARKLGSGANCRACPSQTSDGARQSLFSVRARACMGKSNANFAKQAHRGKSHCSGVHDALRVLELRGRPPTQQPTHEPLNLMGSWGSRGRGQRQGQDQALAPWHSMTRLDSFQPRGGLGQRKPPHRRRRRGRVAFDGTCSKLQRRRTRELPQDGAP